jgi:hypothetical protein
VCQQFVQGGITLSFKKVRLLLRGKAFELSGIPAPFFETLQEEYFSEFGNHRDLW